MVRRIVGARLSDRATIDDIVQETLVRVLGAADRIDPGMLEPYAIATAKNTVAALFKQRDRHSRNQHRVVDLRAADVPGDDLLAKEQQAAIAKALARLPELAGVEHLRVRAASRDNNRFEQARQPTRVRERVMRRLRSPPSP